MSEELTITLPACPFRYFPMGAGPELEYDQEVTGPDGVKRLIPFRLDAYNPIVKPIFQLMENYRGLDDRFSEAVAYIRELQVSESALKDQLAKLQPVKG